MKGAMICFAIETSRMTLVAVVKQWITCYIIVILYYGGEIRDIMDLEKEVEELGPVITATFVMCTFCVFFSFSSLLMTVTHLLQSRKIPYVYKQ